MENPFEQTSRNHVENFDPTTYQVEMNFKLTHWL